MFYRDMNIHQRINYKSKWIVASRADNLNIFKIVKNALHPRADSFAFYDSDESYQYEWTMAMERNRHAREMRWSKRHKRNRRESGRFVNEYLLPNI